MVNKVNEYSLNDNFGFIMSKSFEIYKLQPVDE